jgi:hypothetical protein
VQILIKSNREGLDMAKKKAAKKAMPAKTETSGSTGWVIAAIVVIVIIALLVMRPGRDAMEKEQAPTGPTEPTVKGAVLTTSEAPTFYKKCVNAIGVVPGTQKVENGVLSVTFKNNGRSAIEGTYFEFSDAEGEKRYKKNADAIEAQGTINYQVDLNQVGSELQSAVKTFVIYPIENGQACENQRRAIISG